MEQYINKSALVAEMERRLDDLYDYLPDASKVENGTITISEACNTGKYTALESFRNYIDTLEVKEVDLEKHLKEDIEDVFFDLDGVAVKGATHYLTVEDVKYIAKHFFELGLSVNNPITAEDRGTAEEIIINL